jgi:hypothetical protein
MKQRMKMIVSAALILCCPFAANADIYKYTDKNGVVHFTNVSGGGKNRKRVSSEPPRARTPSPAAHSSAGTISSSNMPSAYLDLINSACSRHGVEPSLVHALIKVESDFNPYAISRKGAMGLMQLMPQTALDLNVRDSFNPAENIDGGVKYLRYLIDRYEGNLSLALAAYNSGETAVKKWGTVPPYRETRNYVDKILRIYKGKGAKSYGSGNGYPTKFTIYTGYGDDGALIFTDNPSNHRGKKLKAKKKIL